MKSFSSTNIPLLRVLTGIIFIATIFSTLYIPNSIYFQIFMGMLLVVALIFEWPKLCTQNPSLWLLTPLYPALPFLLLIKLAHQGHSNLLIILFLLVCAHDTGSYIIGSLSGKHKICPSVSPGKSWEGFFSGYIIAVLTMLLYIYIQNINAPAPLSRAFKNTNIFLFLLSIFIICAISLSGDLFESWLKRKSHLKDSGNFFPGHGGILDRFDGVLFVIIIVYIVQNHIKMVIPFY